MGTKAQGVLVGLATDPELARTRYWLQGKLWSDRSGEQASASLRQALSAIRRSLGGAQDILIADRHAVRLDPTRVAVRDDPATGLEFLEGLDVRDPAFRTWLQQVRAERAPAAPVRPAPAPGPVQVFAPRRRRQIVLECVGVPGSPLHLIEEQFCDSVQKSLAEMFEIDAHRTLPGTVRAGLLVLSVHAFAMPGGALGLRVAVTENSSLRSFWADTAVAPPPAPPALLDLQHLALSHRAVTAVVQLVSRPAEPGLHDPDADMLAGTGLRKMFSMRWSELDEAEMLFRKAYELEPRGLYHAWLAQLAAIRFVEHRHTNRLDAAEQARGLCSDALAAEPTNSFVLSAVANARLVLEQDGVASRELSQLGIAANGSNPLAWWARSSALLYTGEFEQAHAAARTAQVLARDSTMRFWTDFQMALTAAVTGRESVAITKFEVSRALNPQFRPPLRYLLGLYSRQHDDDSARRTLELLRRAEPGFELERFIGDDTYPVSMMRKRGLYDPDRLLDL